MKDHYLFTSARLGFRNWREADIPKMSLINADPKVMKFFPGLVAPKQTEEFAGRMQRQFREKNFCYFAVDRLDTNEFIGFIGLSEPNFTVDFPLGTDIGWRLAHKEWHKGFATEGAKACLTYAFEVLELPSVMAICPEVNHNSVAVMKKIGMHLKRTFNHPLLKKSEDLKRCVLYELERQLKL